MRHATALLGVVLLLAGGGRGTYTKADTLRALDGASPLVRCIVNAESSFDPNAIGRHHERGAVQLLPAANGGGEEPVFLYGDWTPLPPELRDVWNPYQEVAYLEWAIAHHRGGAWSTFGGCGGWG